VSSLRIDGVEFAGAVGQPGGPKPGTLPQVAFSGRSNVGKSSLINRLLGRTRTHVARVSATPGKTQEINFYQVRATAEAGDTDGAPSRVDFYLVDLPGYGYARVPLELRGRWRPMIERYLKETPELLGVVQLVDARHGPTRDDLQMLQFLETAELPTMVVLTKTDKLGRQERQRLVPAMSERLGVDLDQVIPFSARTGEGRDELLAALESLLLA
jgi:GTP-binding protein